VQNPLLTSNEQLVKITAGMHPECFTVGAGGGEERMALRLFLFYVQF